MRRATSPFSPHGILSAIGLVIAAALAMSEPAAAAPPWAGTRYLLESSSLTTGESVGVLQLTPDGQDLSSDGLPFSPIFEYFGSYVSVEIGCGDSIQDVDFLFGAPEQPVAVGPDGAFSATVSDIEPGFVNAVAQLEGKLQPGRSIVRITGGQLTDADQVQCPIKPMRFVFRPRRMPAYPSCAGAPGKPVLRTSSARLYKNWGEDERGRDTYAYACLLQGGRQIPLGRSSADDTFGTLGRFHLAGVYASFVDEVHVEFDFNEESLSVADLRGFGSETRTVTPVPHARRETFGGHFERTALTARGTSAWISSYCVRETCKGGRHRSVWIADASGAHLVDHGMKIKPLSLRVRGHRVYWTNGRRRRSAEIS